MSQFPTTGSLGRVYVPAEGLLHVWTQQHSCFRDCSFQLCKDLITMFIPLDQSVIFFGQVTKQVCQAVELENKVLEELEVIKETARIFARIELEKSLLF